MRASRRVSPVFWKFRPPPLFLPIRHNVLLCSTSMLEDPGYTMDEVLGQPLNLLIPEDFREVHCHHPKNSVDLVEDNCLLAEHWLVFGRRKDGSESPPPWALHHRNWNWAAKIITILCTDVTRQVKAEEALLAAHDQLEMRVLERTEELRAANGALKWKLMSASLLRKKCCSFPASSCAWNGIVLAHLVQRVRIARHPPRFRLPWLSDPYRGQWPRHR